MRLSEQYPRQPPFSQLDVRPLHTLVFLLGLGVTVAYCYPCLFLLPVIGFLLSWVSPMVSLFLSSVTGFLLIGFWVWLAWRMVRKVTAS